ncbi:hypothetical protein C0J52_24634 [Blattella germanica]|nr:hypothetical protein C0J52_24634 [Blattella germanica]
MPIDLYYTMGSTPCHSVLLLLKYMGLDVNLKSIDLQKDEQDMESFVKVRNRIKLKSSLAWLRIGHQAIFSPLPGWEILDTNLHESN